MVMNTPAAGYKSNVGQELRSHSSVLYNERMAILFYRLDNASIDLNMTYQISDILKVKSLLLQIYKNIRCLISNNPICRATLNLETQQEGIYVTDVAFGIIDKMVQHCEIKGYSSKKLYIVIEELNKLEVVIKRILQYHHYFLRPDFRQKPDIDIATEKYKENADLRTIEELKEIVGKRNYIDFDSLGSSRIEVTKEIKYDPSVDADDEENEVKPN